jgi:hypothetical protein
MPTTEETSAEKHVLYAQVPTEVVSDCVYYRVPFGVDNAPAIAPASAAALVCGDEPELVPSA